LGALIGAARKLILVSKYSNAGNLNKVTLPATLNQAYFDALINNADRSLRWYPLPKFVNVQIPKAESVFETFEDGSKKFVHEGVRSMTALFPGVGPQYLSVLKSGRCSEMAAYIIDKNGALVGLTNDEEGVLYPFSINQGTMDAILQWATDTTGTNIAFQMEFDVDMKDEEISLIANNQLVSVNLLNLVGLYDAKVSYTSTGQTAMVIKLYAKYGNAGQLTPIQGLLAADFALYNVTTSAAVTVATAVESTTVPGTYTLTYTSQTIGNVIRLTPTKSKIDFANVVLTTSVVA
jgi:hypothetical protein